MIELRPFRKEDWYGYAGAEPFDDGSDPLIGEIEVRVEGLPYFAIVILDAEGLHIDAQPADDLIAEELLHNLGEDAIADEAWEQLEVAPFGAWFSCPEAARALAMLRDGVSDVELRAMPGFEEVSS